MDLISIQLNNNLIEIGSSSNITTLLKTSNLPDSGIAVAVNNTVVPKLEWEAYHLKSNDAVTVIQATQGG